MRRKRITVLGPLGERRAVVAGGVGLKGRALRAAGLPTRDADDTRLHYAMRRPGRGAVQLVPRVTAAVSPRLRRLTADYQLVRTEFSGHPYIDVQPAGGYPPERYLITYHVKGVEALDRNEMPILRNEHVADIYLHRGYPREKPKCVLRTPIFHPNFGSYICIADHWAPGETLADIIVHIGQMIQYDSYNPDSPLDGVAARWARRHEHLFPVGTEPLYQPEVDISFGGAASGPEEEIHLGPAGPQPPPQTSAEPEDDAIQLSFD